MLPALRIISILLTCGLLCIYANGYDGEGKTMMETGRGVHSCRCRKAADGEGKATGEKGRRVHGCQCREADTLSEVTGISECLWTLQGRPVETGCHRSRESRVRSGTLKSFRFQLALCKFFISFAGPSGPSKASVDHPPRPTSPVHKLPFGFLARRTLGHDVHHAMKKAPSPSNTSSSHQGSPPVVSPLPHVQGYAPAPQPSASAPSLEDIPMAPASSSSPAHPPRTPPRRHHHKHHRGVPSPVLSPDGAPHPAHEHPSTTISPPPDCSGVVCISPLTKASSVTTCGCVRPIEVEIELSMPLYSLFPIISVLAGELAKGVGLSPGQVEIIGANALGANQGISVIDANLVPLEDDFDMLTATSISQKLWSHELVLNKTLFGDYAVVYVHYPGLPPSPPAAIFGGQVTGVAGIQKPFGVDVSRPSEKKLGTSTLAAIALSSIIGLAVCLGAVFFTVLKCRHIPNLSASKPALVPARSKKAGFRSFLFSDFGSSACLSRASSTVTYASTARIFTIAELDRATEQFALENVVGEGGFGRVFRGVLDDGTEVAVKVLTRDHHEGDKEFISEVEMLSRLHHRNLVKLIGICTKDHARCLVYELVPNGSVESHLHGKDACVLDWATRMKIALGSARGLAYLHEDSSPCVIHRDFKAGNILLEKDFNPKVSDFGLAKTAPEGGSRHLSTRVMGTFGYVAPEYAMTGHLLVKSDVYSYGVVLLELLTGRKPVDMSQPFGQENLVTWARPLLASKEGLQVLADPGLKDTVSLDSIERVAAIASMCVHPEVASRPFMGEVVQALKLVCNDLDVSNQIGSSLCSEGDNCSYDSGKRHMHHGFSYEVAGGGNAFSITSDHGYGHVDVGTHRLLQESEGLQGLARPRHPRASPLRRLSLSGPVSPIQSKLATFTQAGLQGSLSEDWHHRTELCSESILP